MRVNEDENSMDKNTASFVIVEVYTNVFTATSNQFCLKSFAIARAFAPPFPKESDSDEYVKSDPCDNSSDEEESDNEDNGNDEDGSFFDDAKQLLYLGAPLTAIEHVLLILSHLIRFD
ncbi:hypothetical protein QAD02_002034 [Eretmocerus hayati]|uniref:Uncharacterized protein n=1 Tax=Eretmocerus hayati TaxID=131215 RepID=A0ACC2NHY5_9HYME|nr:hypothetical protein QAD02_002034 [Eretmocerus hayati]